ncbi:MAG: class I SAM-dependent methyltransferase [Rhodobacteraceae bacterium]|nr:class I SAM-dependent methyltransferase [Paracoccaceae bacterium]
MGDKQLDAVYAARTTQEAESAYDAWASDYDADLMRMGYRLPWHFAAAVLTHVPRAGPILDAGCGTGLQMEPLYLMGWRGVTGVDLSEGMLKVAGAKGLYDDLQKVDLSQPLPFDSDRFAACFCVGTLTPGHAPIEALDELIRVTRPGGHLVFSLRHDAGQLPHYPEYVDRLVGMGRIAETFRSATFATMPLGEPAVRNAVHVMEVQP